MRSKDGYRHQRQAFAGARRDLRPDTAPRYAAWGDRIDAAGTRLSPCARRV
ncbi:MAG TPA: hypothetical protein VH916_02450 [Dehalococcoidia bacterium]